MEINSGCQGLLETRSKGWEESEVISSKRREMFPHMENGEDVGSGPSVGREKKEYRENHKLCLWQRKASGKRKGI